ncbi:hypothetical protein P5V15_001202 [Pogonomyrmex californicus]
MLPKLYSWTNLMRVSRQFDSKRNICINCCFVRSNPLNLISIPKINRTVHLFAPSVSTIRKTRKMPHVIDVNHSQISRFIVTHAAKNPLIKNGFDYISKIPLLNACIVEISSKLRYYIEECASLCSPKDIYICNGTDLEYLQMLKILQKNGTIECLPKYENW